jgi:hypothetical protein
MSVVSASKIVKPTFSLWMLNKSGDNPIVTISRADSGTFMYM